MEPRRGRHLELVPRSGSGISWGSGKLMDTRQQLFKRLQEHAHPIASQYSIVSYGSVKSFHVSSHSFQSIEHNTTFVLDNVH
jgi:hypothetical protein